MASQVKRAWFRAAIAALATVPAALVFLAGPAQAATVSAFGSTGAASGPVGITLDPAGNVYTANNFGNSISKLSAGGGGPAGAPWPVSATAASPWGIVYTDVGSVFFSNSNFYAGPGPSVGRISTATGTAFGAPWPVSTTGNTPLGITADREGNLYTTNLNSSSVTRISTDGLATTFATTGAGTGPKALAFDRDGNLYTANSGDGTVSKFTAAGAPAGAPWPVSFGLGAEGITLDSSGNVFVANGASHTVSKITPAGVVTTIPLGNPTNPNGITVDSAGNVYTANAATATISKITPAGNASLLASGGGLSGTTGITIDRDGNLFVTNYNGNSVSRITPVGGDIQPAPPATPAAPSATAGDGSATVTVLANDETDRRYGAPSSYTVAAVQEPSRTCTVTPPATSCRVTGLTNGTTYTFTARANLNTWQTGASVVSAAPVTPTPTASVASVKGQVTRKTASITSRVTVSGAGIAAQRATSGTGSKRRTWCRASRTTAAASTQTFKCNLGGKGREALRKGQLKLTLRTTYTSTAGGSVTVNRKVTLKRKR